VISFQSASCGSRVNKTPFGTCRHRAARAFPLQRRSPWYAKNSRTAPEFIIEGQKDFEQEKARLIGFITKTQQLGAAHFEGKENFSFGPMTAQEWNGLFYKHLDHHLMQFGV